MKLLSGPVSYYRDKAKPGGFTYKVSMKERLFLVVFQHNKNSSISE